MAFNLTKRQIICMVIGALVGIPFYFLTRNLLGISNAATGMVLLMLPAFLFAMYEKDGMAFGTGVDEFYPGGGFLRPMIRRYETENLYEQSETIVEAQKHVKGGKKRVKKK